MDTATTLPTTAGPDAGPLSVLDAWAAQRGGTVSCSYSGRAGCWIALACDAQGDIRHHARGETLADAVCGLAQSVRS